MQHNYFVEIGQGFLMYSVTAMEVDPLGDA